MMQLAIALGATAALQMLAAAAPAEPALKPHLIFMLGDEVGWNNVGWHNPAALTPNLDTLAKSGIILNASYVQRWCAPTRASLMSGRYAYNTGMNEYNQHKLGVTEEMAGVPMSFDFIPKVLKKAGYVSHQVGKWHIGFFDHDHVPVGRGFETSFGYMLGASSHDNRSSQVSHTCGVAVKDLY
jgi:arylsulfatase B/arylsulfatase I/J